MRQGDFEQRYADSWARLDDWLQQKPTRRDDNDAPTFDLPAEYRSLCQQLAMAKERQYTSALVEKLNRLVLSAHHRLYRQRGLRSNTWFWYLLAGFPRAVRAQSTYVWIATALFLVPGLLFGLAAYFDDAIIYAVMSPEQVNNFESMYDPSNRVLGRERDAGTDLQMFGHYIRNNIGIAFRTFAGGVAFGLGSIFFLVFNGVVIGAVFGHITRVGFISTFYSFVAGHGAFELTAIVLAGAAGLMLGHSLVDPRGHTRVTALRIAAGEAMKIMYGVFLMLVVAAFIEAFWSSTTGFEPMVKYAVGGTLWVLVIGYFVLAGRGEVRRAA